MSVYGGVPYLGGGYVKKKMQAVSIKKIPPFILSKDDATLETKFSFSLNSSCNQVNCWFSFDLATDQGSEIIQNVKPDTEYVLNLEPGLNYVWLYIKFISLQDVDLELNDITYNLLFGE